MRTNLSFVRRVQQVLIIAAGLLPALYAQAALNIQHWETSNGSAVYFVENHDLPIIDISTNFAAGSARDGDKPGLAGLTRYLMTLGAGGMSDEQISSGMADVGAILGGDLDADRAALKLRTLSSEREQKVALDIYTKILHQPDFPETTLAREKARIVAGLKEAATQPASIANRAFLKALYGSHPYAVEEEGEPEAVSALSQADLQQFYRRYYGARNAVIALMGDLTPEQARAIAERISAGLPDSPAAAALPEVAYPQAAVERRIPHPASQSHIMLGYPGVKRGDPDYFALYVGNYILGGGGFVSRLTEEVREKRGLVYSVYSYFLPMQQLGQFQIGLQTKRDQADDALRLVRETLANFISKGVTEAELKAAKQNIVGGFPLRIDSNSKILDYLAVIGFYRLPLNYLDEFNGKVEAVTAAQIKDAFSRRIDPEKMVTVVVGGTESGGK
ncbi:M16 family metallopeptidase [Methylobacillus flagellatus]|uniref:Peptidase PqqG, involved in biosynthesis of pyrroloquinoline quinone n=1 Tax=Methylobacillus flagellatus (strain ATCC 51484 / DSM 6875 / VKM B-1610 / KT) TaxID=265072 RepID=Q1H3D4_METFK|nr:pitrilysin family protein [Methylobacillus flagellatus]ABE49003.1 Peptidase PqqG, involved in biosynthesis of pyrroloquinoline quinone [Methylobacillus flagellatus KT]